MTIAITEAKPMARKKVAESRPTGAIIQKNLVRLGYGEVVIRATEVADKVREVTGKPMSRQRLAHILNAIDVTDTTLETLAEGLGVKPEELLRDD